MKLPFLNTEITYHSYGFLLALGFFIGIIVAVHHAKKENINPDHIMGLSFWVILGAIVGSRLLHVFSVNTSWYFKHPVEILRFWRGGFAYYGGFLGAFILGGYYIYKRRLPFWKIGDVVAPSVALGLMFGRMGCFLAGCCYGKPSPIPWFSVTFTHPDGIGRKGVPLIPTQLISSFNGLVIFLILLAILRKRRFNGQVFLSFIIIYAVTRFIIEFFRDDPRGEFLGITTSQWIGIPLVIFAVTSWILLTRRRERSSQ